MTQRRFTQVTAVAVLVAIAFTAVLTLSSTGSAGVTLPYENALFAEDTLMTVEITVPQEDWDGLIESAREEQYITADIAINGTLCKTVGIRCKGNSSLTRVEDDRYSFKVKFDEYVGGQTLLGLDKIVFNNTQSDATWMKEYLSYYTMKLAGVATPLFGFAKIYVNGEYFGLYLAIEVLEDSFAERNFGYEFGELYKVESMEMGGGGGGNPPGGAFRPQDMLLNMGAQAIQELVDRFSADEVQNMLNILAASSDEKIELPEGVILPEGVVIPEPGEMTVEEAMATMPAEMMESVMETVGNAMQPQMPEMTGGMPQMPDEGGEMPPAPGGEMPQMPGEMSGMPAMPTEDGEATGENDANGHGLNRKDEGGFAMFMGGNGSDLNYVDDSIDSYSAIFGNTVFKDTTDADKQRVVTALKGIADETSDISDYVMVDDMLGYIAANAAVGNGDGYFGSMIHNYYLYEDEGKITMLPWDYNLAYGGFSSNADTLINLDIDAPFLSGDIEDRTIIRRLLEDPEYLETYHQYIRVIAEFYTNGAAELIDRLDALIGEWVEQDPTKEYTYEQYQQSLPVFKEYLNLRGLSMLNQLDGNDERLDTSTIELSALGSSGMGGGHGFRETNEQSPEEPAAANAQEMPARDDVAQATVAQENSAQSAEKNAAVPAGSENAVEVQGQGAPMTQAQGQGARGDWGGGMGMRGGGWGQNAQQDTSGQTALWLGVSAALLAMGLVFAKVYPFHKRRR